MPAFFLPVITAAAASPDAGVVSFSPALILAAIFTAVALSVIATMILVLRRRDGAAAAVPADTAEPARWLQIQAAALEASNDGIAIVDANGLFEYVNRAYAALHGFSKEELLKHDWRLVYPETEATRFRTTVFPSLALDGSLRVEARGLKKDGSSFAEELTLSAGPDGAIIHVVRDLTTRTEAANEADRLGLLAKYSPNIVIRFDRAGVITFANPTAQDTLGLTPGVPSLISNVIEAAPRFDAAACIERGELRTCSARINGRHYHFVVRGISELDFGHAYGSDVTDLKRAHQKLIESRKFLRKVIDANPNFIFVKDAKGRYTLANQAVADAYGTTVGALVGHTDADFNVPLNEIERAQADDAAVINNLEHRFAPEQPLTDAQQKTRWLQVVKKPLVMNRTGEVRVLGVATDITERKVLQDQLLQSQKMEAIGQLAGGVSHDFNNLLTGILGYTALLKITSEKHPEVIKTAELIENTAHRAAALTQKLLGFARKGKHQNVPVNLHTTIDETLAILQRTIEKNIAIRLNCSAIHSVVLGDPVQLQQVILNLAINARDAMSCETGGTDGGILSISTDVITLGANSLLPEPGLKPGSYLEIAVRDTGCGIPAANRERIFEPFFTTKEPNRGTGMGLAMVYGIVRNHGGAISVYSVEGQGSVFRILLPCSESLPAVLPTVLPARPAAGKGRVLVVDDHPVVRQVTARMLGALGYRVTTANDGVEALEYYRDHVADIDLVLIDMVMPRMGARECFRALKTINPGVRAILSTGYVKNNAVQEIMVDGMAGFVQKPYELNQLAELVEQVLRGGTAEAPESAASELPPAL